MIVKKFPVSGVQRTSVYQTSNFSLYFISLQMELCPFYGPVNYKIVGIMSGPLGFVPCEFYAVINLLYLTIQFVGRFVVKPAHGP